MWEYQLLAIDLGLVLEFVSQDAELGGLKTRICVVGFESHLVLFKKNISNAEGEPIQRTKADWFEA